MKTITTCLLCLALSISAFAQKCTYNVEDTDSKSGLKKRHIMNAVTNQFIVWTNNDEGVYKIGLEVTMTELQKESIHKGDTLTILLVNDETIEAYADANFLPIGKADEMTEATNYFPFYTISAKDWLKLCATNVQVIKVTFGKEYVGFEINESKAKKIKAAALCVK